MVTLKKAKHSKNPLERKRANFAINFGHRQQKNKKVVKRMTKK